MKPLRPLPAVGLYLLTTLAGSTAGAANPESRMPLLMPDDFAELCLCSWSVEPEPGTPD